MGRPGLFFLILIGMALMNNGYAKNVGKPFSATAVQLTPQGAIQTRVFITKDAIRNEYEQNGNRVIEIIHPDDNKRVLLFPKEKVFTEQLAPVFPDRRVTDDGSPCSELPGTLCRVIGNEVINGVETEKWEFSQVVNGRPVHALQWIDKRRKLPVREFHSDGTVIEMSLLGEETINSREAEKWRMQIMRADGQRSQFLQWYDPELKLIIREEHPDGYVRELRDIKTGAQKNSLFTIPNDYERRAQPPRKSPPQRGFVQPPAGDKGKP